MSSENNHVKILVCWGGSWELVNGLYEYLPSGLPRRAVTLPINAKYSKLKKLIARKANLQAQQEFRLCYKMFDYTDPIDIFDDEDVGHLIEVVRNNPFSDVTLFVVSQMGLGSGSNQPIHPGDSTGFPNMYHPQHINDYPSQHTNDYPYQHINDYPFQPVNTYPSQEMNQFHPNQYVPSHQNLSQTMGYYEDVVQPTFEVEKGRRRSTSTQFRGFQEPGVYVDLNYNPLTDPDVAKKFGISLSSSSDEEDDKKEDDKKYSEDAELEDSVGVPPQMQPNYFWSMPDPLECPTFQETPAVPRSYVPSSKVYVGQFFNTKDELKVLLGVKCLEEGYEFRVSQSTTTRFEAKCVNEGCEWFFRATKLKNDNSIFQVKTLKDHHTCPKTQTNPNHRNANKHVLGHILREQLKDSSRVYRGKDIITDLNQRFKIDVSYSQAWRGKCRAIELLRGTDEESFYQLPIYLHNLTKANPGTCTHIQTDELGRFENLFVAIGAAVRSFAFCCRPVLIIDGAHLKGRFLGTNFLAVGMDGNNQILPVAYGVGKTESGESWIWFLTKLKETIGDIPDLAIISDRAASIALAIRQVWPHAYHGLCCRHLMINLGLNRQSKKKFQGLYWKTCKAYTVDEFEAWKARLQAAVPSTSRIMLQAGLEKWSRAHFPGERYNIMTSNSAESINALSKYARKLPIVQLIEFFRQSIQKWYFVRREIAAQLPNEFTPWAEHKFDKRKQKSFRWKVHGISRTQFEVDDGDMKGLVDFTHRTCTCRKWQLSRIPCGHVISTARWLKLGDCNQFFSGVYTKESYKQTYEEKIYPLPAQSAWEQPTDFIQVLPPLMNKRQAGRPREINRFPSRGEEKKEIRCSRCHEKGHMRNKCTAPIPSESTWYSKARKLFGKKNTQPSKKFQTEEEFFEPEEDMDDTVDLNDF